MYNLENEKLKINVKKIGAELCKIVSVKHDTNFMWNADSNVWGSFAPNLFPIIGALKNNTYILENESFELPKHGFIRHNTDIQLHKQNENSLVFKLTYNEALLKMYPFKFEFYITYKLNDNSLEVQHTIKNIDNKVLYFSLGGHPAFKCPVFENENYDDYILEFEQIESSNTHLINPQNGLISSNTRAIFNNTNQLKLTHNLFNDDALVFKDLKSRKVTLKSNLNGEILSVSYPDYNYLGIWAKPNGDFVCIEPWLGIADNENTNQDFKTKEGILKLDANKTFEASYLIEINNAHLH
ncbi:aldose 1-epimerase family protein [Seonamhaeicola sp. MEBiC1930]|uniref:aldose 1-epimerase family protein n=1 Tax=Seonamhaeicola sp. MEBiC01930 TaxID=2976768 RepID=UPI00324E5FB0